MLTASTADCRAAYDALRYKEAALACQAALPQAPDAQLPELYRLLGLSLAALGDGARAQSAFESLLALDPSSTLAQDYSPKIRASFDAAKARSSAHAARLEAAPVRAPRAGEPLTLEVSIEDGPAHPVTRVSVKGSGTPLTSSPRATPPELTRVELAPPPSPATLELEVGALDLFGGRLASRTIQVAVREAPSKRAGWKKPWPWLGAAAVVGVGGATMGWLGQREGSQALAQTFADDADRLAQRSHAMTTGANVAFGIAGAAAIAAGIAWWSGEHP